MNTLEGKRVVVTGGSRGLGLGMVEALVERRAQVTVVARGKEALDAVRARLGVATVAGDIADEAIARKVLADVRPDVLVLNAGATPVMKPLHEQTWEGFSNT